MRRMMLLAATMAALVAMPLDVEAKGRRAEGVPRDGGGRIVRGSTARTQFRKANPCPATGRASGACPGYVIDHVVALKRGGPDHPDNMQWQTKAEARAKDRWE